MPPYILYDSVPNFISRPIPIGANHLTKALDTISHPELILRFRDSIGVEDYHVTWIQLHLSLSNKIGNVGFQTNGKA
jgi:hypothetical protein